jgi:hydrogenase/urease accessory protein HupE
MIARFILLLVLLGSTVSGALFPSALAHDSRPVSVRIEQKDSDLFQAQWHVPGSVEYKNIPFPTMPNGCLAVGTSSLQRQPGTIIGDQLYRCSGGLPGNAVGLAYPHFNPSLTTVIRITWMSGQVQTGVLGPEQATWTVPDKETVSGVSRHYFGLGMSHIFSGYDHLLFLICVLFIARTPRRIIATVTGFTLAHSVTLALAALGVIHVSVLLVEALIALSIVFVAAEIARNNKETLTFQYPFAVTGVFGLLHGLGFASVLGEIGLPQTQLPLALLLFNVGIEVGQLIIVAAVLLPIFLFKKPLARFFESGSLSPATLRLAAIYPVGLLAAYWMFDRMGGL